MKQFRLFVAKGYEHRISTPIIVSFDHVAADGKVSIPLKNGEFNAATSIKKFKKMPFATRNCFPSKYSMALTRASVVIVDMLEWEVLHDEIWHRHVSIGN